MTARSPDFDTILAHGASHRYAGGENAVIRVVAGAALSLTSGHVMFDYPHDPVPGYCCPLRQGMLPETPPVPPGRYPVHLIVADITDAAGGPDVISKVAAVRLVVRDEPAVAWDIHNDYVDGLTATADVPPDMHNIVALTDCQMCGTFDDSYLHEISSWIGDRAESQTASNFDASIGPGPLVDQHLPPWPMEGAMVMFPSGWAYGHYRTWAGSGADGGLVCLLTDFEVLSQNVGPDPRLGPPPVPAAPTVKAGHLSSPGAEMVEPYGGGTGFRFKIRNVKIDGQGDAVHVRGGGSHEVSFDVLHDCPECGNAINQVIVGLAGQDHAQASVWNGQQRSGRGNPGPAEWVTVSCDIVIPGKPGTYSVRARYAQAHSGKDALGWWKVDRPDGPGPESTIGTIIVEP